MSKHTPGPWEYIPDDGDYCGAIKAATGWVCDLVDPPSQEDAVLMAAAPELLEALEMALKTTYSDKLHAEWTALIAKAKGE